MNFEPQTENIPVLIVADNASQRFGGEAFLPLQYFRRLRARGLDCRLVTHERVRPELVALLANDIDRVHFVHDTWLHKVLHWIGSRLPRRLSQATVGTAMTLSTQLASAGVIRRLLDRYDVRVIHQPTPVSPRVPSAIAGLGVPVVIGPMNGGMTYPPVFRRTETITTRSVVHIARLLSPLSHLVFRGKRDAAVLLAANERTREALPKVLSGRVVTLAENAVDLALWSARKPEDAPRAHFVYVGRLVDWKRVDLLMRALVAVPDATLELLGDGIERPSLERLAADLGVAQRISFRGYQPQERCAQSVRRATALVLPSIYESGGAVVLEAMAVGVPVIVTEWGGPLDYVDDTCSILVPPTSEDGLIKGFSEAMRALVDDPPRAAALGAGGRRLVEARYSWDAKIDQMLAVYASAVASAYGVKQQLVPQYAARDHSRSA